jgi:lysyl-tRNA synthetase class 1
MTNDTRPSAPVSDALFEAAQDSKSWPFEEARRLVKRMEQTGQNEILFETGYGPSGLPHIGTFGEVARTSMVRHAFQVLTKNAVPSRLLCYSDDLDGFRKVPDNVPNREVMAQYLEKPLSRIPDPFSNEYTSFGAANNARLQAFLDRFGFDYEFASSSDYYAAGRFDEMLLRMLSVYDKVMAVILPTLGPERQATYSPFLPISPHSGKVLQVPMLERHPDRGTVVYRDPDADELVETTVTGGAVKCQWKADWALRWAALGVDYEMSGKDLIDSVTLSTKICRVLGVRPPDCFTYEHFLDENGQKISKSKGNGLTIDEWLTYASPESLSLFMFQKPKTAKRLYFDIIPKTVDDYVAHLSRLPKAEPKDQLNNPCWHIHAGNIPTTDLPVSFAMLLNLVSASNASTPEVLWGFISQYAPGSSAETNRELDALVGYAIRYFHDFVKPTKVFKSADETERQALANLRDALAALPFGADGEEIQNEVLNVGRAFERFQDPKRKSPDGGPAVTGAWFQTLYQILLGQERGPRFGSFVALYGVPGVLEMIDGALAK